MRANRLLLALVPVLPWAGSAAGAVQTGSTDPGAALVLRNDLVEYALGADGRNLRFVERAGGRDLLSGAGPNVFASATVAGTERPASAIEWTPAAFTVRFGDSGVSVRMAAEVEPTFIRIRVLGVEGEGLQQLRFAHVVLDVSAKKAAGFATCALALNLRTNNLTIPQDAHDLHGLCYRRFGFEGAAVAIIGCPAARLREVMKQVVRSTPEIPQTDIGGPWALDCPAARGSYLMDVNQPISEANADDWIALGKSLGIRQLDFHMGRTLRFGDYEPDPEYYPNGLEGLRRVIDRIHAAGMMAGFHTYSQFLAKNCRWVSPVPDRRLARRGTFTLAEDLSADAAALAVRESTANVSTDVGFLFRNSVTLQIDDELIVFKGVRREAPWGFTECQRGACGTKAAAHAAGAPVHHIEELFGLFCPDGDTSLPAEVAARSAEVFNTCGFDMIYLDALDGSHVSAGPDPADAWHYAAAFAWELARRLDRPALFEMSTFGHHLWYIRSRMGAWDVPARAAKRFIDLHTMVNESCRDFFLPAHLGWWGFHHWAEVQPERTFPDDIEYLMSRCIAHDCGVSITAGMSPQDYARSWNTRRLGEIVRRYEELRTSGRVPPAVRAGLAGRGREFTLQPQGDAWAFREVRYLRHKVEDHDGRTSAWTLVNPFDEQPVRVRIEALASVDPFDSPEAGVLLDEKGMGALGRPQTAGDVRTEVSTSGGGPEAAAEFSATSGRETPLGAWATVGTDFAPPVDMAGRGLGVWIEGDGSGALLNIQLRGAAHTAGGYRDSYVKIDFSGRRYFELVEPESDAMVEYDWPYCGHRDLWEQRRDRLLMYAYPTMHYWMDYRQVAALNLWYNDLPPGRTVRCRIGAIRTLPLRSVKVVRPTISVNGAPLGFPVELESGSYLEFAAPGDCRIYDRYGSLVGEPSATGPVPRLSAGPNRLTFSCDNAATSPPPRVRVTVMAVGPWIH